MLQRLPANESPVRIVLEQARQQVRGGVAPEGLHRDEVGDGSLGPLRELGVVIRQAVHAVPIRLGIRRAPALEDLDQLIDVGPAREQGQARRHLGEDAPHGPDVDSRRVALGAEQQLRRAVPEGDDLVGVGAVWEAGEPGESEVGEFEG